MSFNPKPEYTITQKSIPIEDFYRYKDEFVIRPPYQRKSVWSTKKKHSLLDSLFRRYYIPKIVVREVRLDDERTVSEIVDGQQRIVTVQEFCADKIKLPKSLANIHPDLVGKLFSELDSDIKRFIDKELQYDADIVKGIDNPKNSEHQRIATEIFWRLQQGESLNFMEIAHARLGSLARNFVVKYADDITFDFESYKPIEGNKSKHKFFKIYSRDNSRMQHLLLMTRFLMLEKASGATELKDTAVANFIDESIIEDGVGNDSLENEGYAKATLSNLDTFYDIFKNDTVIDNDSGMRELSREYVVISFYLLIKHLRQNYAFGENEKTLVHDFLVKDFYPRWSKSDESDADIQFFSNSRQMDTKNTEDRSQVIRQLFFEFVSRENKELSLKDEQRVFNEAQKIEIYRHDRGLCQACIAEGKPEKEARVSWSEYEADHILAHSNGGQTEVDNAQVLCRHHNRTKSNK